MSGALGGLRRRLFTPAASETSLEKRGFHVKDDTSKELLEHIGATFLSGFALTVAAGRPDPLAPQLDALPPRFRGFAYEGAAMGVAVADSLRSWRRSRFTGFLQGMGRDHVYMAHVGLGWGLARIPRIRWPRPSEDPLLEWLVLDGYGFHEAYFRTDRVVRRRAAHPDVPWGDEAFGSYRGRAMDQGVGRALWFVGGTDADVVADLIERFEPGRRPDLYSGAGLAATYAGGAGPDELVRFRDRAGALWPYLAQGATFAAECRRRAGNEVPHTDVATAVFCGLPAADAALVAVGTRPEPGFRGTGVPAYEVWRGRIVEQFQSLRRV